MITYSSMVWTNSNSSWYYFFSYHQYQKITKIIIKMCPFVFCKPRRLTIHFWRIIVINAKSISVSQPVHIHFYGKGLLLERMRSVKRCRIASRNIRFILAVSFAVSEYFSRSLLKGLQKFHWGSYDRLFHDLLLFILAYVLIEITTELLKLTHVNFV